jgi:hypothetical protein
MSVRNFGGAAPLLSAGLPFTHLPMWIASVAAATLLTAGGAAFLLWPRLFKLLRFPR